MKKGLCKLSCFDKSSASWMRQLMSIYCLTLQNIYDAHVYLIHGWFKDLTVPSNSKTQCICILQWIDDMCQV